MISESTQSSQHPRKTGEDRLVFNASQTGVDSRPINLEPQQKQSQWALFRSVLTALAVQLGGRLATFTINTVVAARIIDPQAYGTAHVSFALLETLSLALLREAFRRTALRRPAAIRDEATDFSETQRPLSSSHDAPARFGTDVEWWKSARQISKLGRVTTFIVTLVAAVLWVRYAPTPAKMTASHHGWDAWYALCIGLVALGVIVSSWSEEAVVLALTQDPLSRTKAEGCASLGRTVSAVVFYSLAAWQSPAALRAYPVHIGLASFAAGHAVYGVVWWLWYCTWGAPRALHPTTESTLTVEGGSNNTSRIAAKAPNKEASTESLHSSCARRWQASCIRRVDGLLTRELTPEHRAVLPLFCTLAIEKIILNEAERLTLLMMFPNTGWASYALVSNLTGILCRLLFSPFEEMATVEFSSSAVETHSRIDSLRSYVEIQGTLGLLAVCFGPPAASAVFILVFGRSWVALGTHEIFGAYCYYILALAINGILEAFMYATAPASWLSKLKLINPVVSLSGVVATIVCKKMFETYHQFLFQGQGTAETQDIYYIYALISATCFSVILRTATVFTFFLVVPHNKARDGEEQTAVNQAQVVQPLRPSGKNAVSNLRLFLSFVIPALAGGALLRCLVYGPVGTRNRMWKAILAGAPTTEDVLTTQWQLLRHLALKEVATTFVVAGGSVLAIIVLTYPQLKATLSRHKKRV